MGEQEALFKTDSVGHMPPVQSGEMFSARKKKKKEPSTFLISSKLGCLSLSSCYDNSCSPPSSFGSISKWRTMDAKDQKMGKASRH